MPNANRTRFYSLFFASAALSLLAGATMSLSAAAQTRVDTVDVKRQHSIQELSVPATVMSRNVSDVSFGAAGRLQDFRVDVGARIEAGEVIATLDSRQIDATITSLQAQQEAAKATLDDEQQQVQELESLAETDFVAQSELRRARAALAVARANVAEYDALLNEREVEREYHRLQAPFSGVVVRRQVDQGEWVNEDQVAFRLVERGHLYVDAYLAQRYLDQIDDNTEVFIEHGDERMAARISAKVPYMSDTDRTFLLRLTPDESAALTVGAAVNAHINLRSQSPRLTVPQDAVIRYSDGRTSVWVIENEDDRAVAREQPVELGERFNGWVVARGENLKENDKVIVRGNEGLTDGDTVQVTESNDYD